MSKYLYGMHDNCEVLGGLGWVVISEELGHDPQNIWGNDYRELPETVIVRLNHGYHPNGTVPQPANLDGFVQRVRNFVSASYGCRHWIISNEPNHGIERPHEMEITPRYYARVYRDCRNAIREVQSDAVVIFAAIAPWNEQSGDWVWYLEEALEWAGEVDGIAIHAYTHGTDPSLITSPDIRHGWHWQFRVYQDAINAIPVRLWNVPLYITETNPGADGNPWPDVNSGWVQKAYAEVDRWNKVDGQTIKCLCLYRWENVDLWGIQGKSGVVEDLYAAMAHGYTWGEQEEQMENFGFELPYHATVDTIKVARGWVPFWSTGDPPREASQGPCVVPEYKPVSVGLDPRRVVEGDTAQCLFIQYKVFNAGVFQRVEATPGKRYQFSVSAQTWCSNLDDPTADDGEMYLSLGVDPYGRTDAFEQGVIWTPWHRQTANHARVESMIVEAEASAITLLICGWNKWRLKHNDLYLDDARMTVIDPGPSDPPEPGECYALTEEQVRTIVREEVWTALGSVGECLIAGR